MTKIKLSILTFFVFLSFSFLLLAFMWITSNNKKDLRVPLNMQNIQEIQRNETEINIQENNAIYENNKNEFLATSYNSYNPYETETTTLYKVRYIYKGFWIFKYKVAIYELIGDISVDYMGSNSWFSRPKITEVNSVYPKPSKNIAKILIASTPYYGQSVSSYTGGMTAVYKGDPYAGSIRLSGSTFTSSMNLDIWGTNLA